MLAAGMAAEHGARVTLLERGPKTGRKLRLTGKGRCNLTNAGDVETFIRAFGPNGRFLYGAFSRFFRDELLTLLGRYGVTTKTERGGRVFPVSDSALDVAAALERWLQDCHVDVRLNTRVRGLLTDNGSISGVDLYHGRMDAGAVIIATGGLSYPRTGSTGDGYDLAAAVGHTITPTAPALVPLLTAEAWTADLSGLALKNVSASLVTRSTGRVIASEQGEMLFTHQGVSGPIILTLSRSLRVTDEPLDLLIDLKPALTADDLRARFVRDFRRAIQFGTYARDLAPHSLAVLLPELTGIPADTRVNQITAAQRGRLIDTLKGLRLTVAGVAPIEEAIVTAGGVALPEIDPRTMMSWLVQGLFFAGEVLDLDAVTGGFNLQAAFSTGAVAGAAAADYLQRRFLPG
jgi:hypothetical protein